jgi:hypothetical protein
MAKQIAPGAIARAMKEGREARKEGRPRINPYAQIPAFRRFREPWFEGWDAMDAVLRWEERDGHHPAPKA